MGKIHDLLCHCPHLLGILLGQPVPTLPYVPAIIVCLRTSKANHFVSLDFSNMIRWGSDDDDDEETSLVEKEE